MGEFRNDQNIYYTRKLRYFVQFYNFIPEIKDKKGKLVKPSELKEITYSESYYTYIFLSLLNSNLFFWFFNVFSDVRNVNRREIDLFRCSLDEIPKILIEKLTILSQKLMQEFDMNSQYLTNNYGKSGTLTIQTFQPRLSKPTIDEIDRVLAQHYGFTDEELDFIINYDIKYRIGADGDD